MGELGKSSVDGVECLVEKVWNGLVGMCQERIEKVLALVESTFPIYLVEVLATPLCCVFSSVSTDVSVLQKWRPSSSLEYSKVPLAVDAGVVIHKRMRVLHRPSTSLVLVLAHSNPKSTL